MRIRYTPCLRVSGLTLIELLVTIALMAILLSVAAPSMMGFVARSSMRGISGDFTLAMQRARTEAINKNQCVAICMSTTVGGTNKCATTGSNWATGWLVFSAPSCGNITNTRPNTSLTPPDAILFVREPANTRYELNASSGTRSVVFNARGLPSSATLDSFNLVDTSAPLSDTINRSFCLDMAGRIRTTDIGGC